MFGFTTFRDGDAEGRKRMQPTALVHLGAGIGNVVLATPLLLALRDLNFVTDVLLAADYAQTAELLRPWAAVRHIFLQKQSSSPLLEYDRVVPAIPPYYFNQYGRVVARHPRAVVRPADTEFYRDEQGFYLSFARKLGYDVDPSPNPSLPVGPSEEFGVTQRTVVLAPGCKTGEMSAKRWPRFVELAETLDDVVVVGTSDDMTRHDGEPIAFPPHVRSFVGKLSLRESAELLASAGVVVGNDSGLSHIASAVGTPTIMIFGPTPHTTLGPLGQNTVVLRRGLPCEPCFHRNRFAGCNHRITCLDEIDTDQVKRAIAHALA